MKNLQDAWKALHPNQPFPKPAPMWLRYLRQLRRLVQPFAPERLPFIIHGDRFPTPGGSGIIVGFDKSLPGGDRTAYVEMKGGKIRKMRITDAASSGVEFSNYEDFIGAKKPIVQDESYSLKGATSDEDPFDPEIEQSMDSIFRLNTGSDGIAQPVDDDAFHYSVAQSFMGVHAAGQLDYALLEKTRWRISWICSKCSIMHFQHGNLVQTCETFMALLQLGYPYLKIENSAFIEVGASEGLDPNDTEAMAGAFRRFMGATHGD